MPAKKTRKTGTRKRATKKASATSAAVQTKNFPEVNSITVDNGYTKGADWAQAIAAQYVQQGYPIRWLVARACASAKGSVQDNEFVKNVLNEFAKQTGYPLYVVVSLGDNQKTIDALAKIFDIAASL